MSPASSTTLYDQFNRPIERAVLTTEVAGPSITGVRSPLTGYPGDGLNPLRLANILRDADLTDPLRYLELAEQIEERDLHYAGVLGTRKRSVAQLDIQVDAASDDKEHVKHADMIRAWLDRDELQSEIFDMLDAIGKGYSLTEIMWDTSSGQWQPLRLEHRDPRWFRFDRTDGRTPLLRGDGGDISLTPFKFIFTQIRAKSGLPVRGGIARLVAWSWMFKAFTMRDWAIFAQTFGQPVRVGKYPSGATDADKETLFRAVANIAGDCAAIIPESMLIEFIESKNVGAGAGLYKERCDWLDQQVSKGVLGQTATTDAVTGGLGSGKEHRAVQEDIERADAVALSAVINRDLVRPWVQLEFGPQAKYPRLRIGRPEEKNVDQIVNSIEKMVPFGLRVPKSFMSDLLSVPDAKPDEELLTAPAAPALTPPPGALSLGAPRLALPRPALQAEAQADDIDELAAAAQGLAQPGLDAMIDTVRELVLHAQTLEDVRDGLLALRPQMPTQKFADAMRLALAMAELSGRADIVDQTA